MPAATTIDAAKTTTTSPSQPSKTMKYFTRADVASHNQENDCWITVFDKVLDITKLLKENQGNVLCRPLIEMAGKDITDWFQSPTHVKTRIDNITGLQVPYIPQGRFLHIPPDQPSNKWNMDIKTPWWSDSKYVIGKLSRNERKVKFVNTLTGSSDIIVVCTEETLLDIQERVKKQVNFHSNGYIWRFGGKKMKMVETLDENGIPDRSGEMAKAGMSEDDWIPVIHLEFADDLTIA